MKAAILLLILIVAVWLFGFCCGRARGDSDSDARAAIALASASVVHQAAHEPTYAEAYAYAEKYNVPLLVFVDQPRRDIIGFVSCKMTGYVSAYWFYGKATKRVVISVWCKGALHWGADIPDSPDDKAIYDAYLDAQERLDVPRDGGLLPRSRSTAPPVVRFVPAARVSRSC